MALPILLALMAASAAANKVGQDKVNRARQRVNTEELFQRKRLQDQTVASAQNTADLLTGTAQKEKDAAAARDAAIPAPSPTGVAPAVPESALSTYAPTDSKVTIEENLRRAAQTQAKLRGIGAGRAGLEDFGNIMAGQSQAVTRNMQDQQQAIQSGNNYEQYVMPAKMQAAMGAGKGYFTLGDVLQLAASIYAPYGLGKAGAAVTAGGAVPSMTGTGATSGIYDWTVPHTPEIAMADMGYPRM